MKFSFKTSLSKDLCLEVLKNVPSAILSTDKFFIGKVKGEQFEFSYALQYSDSVGSIHKTKTLPYCSISGKVNSDINSEEILIQGSVGLVRMRTIIVSIIFAFVFICLETLLILKNGPFIRIGIFLLLGFGTFFYSELRRYFGTRKEALAEFEKLFK